MNSEENTTIIVRAIIKAPIEQIWKNWVTPSDITRWNNASEDWFTPRAENDLRPGGKFLYRMEAKDGSFGFDFEGVYDIVKEQEYIEYHLADGRKVKITFKSTGKGTEIVESFDAESVNSIDLQRSGWQAILNNFKKHTETVH
jgi:uncharacterized protein YndB with AHSA1/START domain